MATRRIDLAIPETFDTSDPQRLRSDLERFAQAVRSREPSDVEIVGDGNILGVGGVYRANASSSPVTLVLPSLEQSEAGSSLTIFRQGGVGTLAVKSQALIDGKKMAYLPEAPGAFDAVWDGSTWTWQKPPRGKFVQVLEADIHMNSVFADEPNSIPSLTGNASSVSDENNPLIKIKKLEGGGIEAISGNIHVPSGSRGALKLTVCAAPEVVPSATGVAELMIYGREITNPVSTFVGQTLVSMAFKPSATGFMYGTGEVPLRELNLSGGKRAQIALVRVGTLASDDLSNDLNVESLTVEIEY